MVFIKLNLYYNNIKSKKNQVFLWIKDDINNLLKNLIYAKEPIQKILITLYNHFKKLYFVKLAVANNKDVATSLNLKANQMSF